VIKGTFMNKTIFLIFLIITLPSSLKGMAFITTAESVAWNGANGSVDDGFESLIYNPAGLFSTNRKSGLNIFGSFGLRVYMNFTSTDDILKALTQTGSNINISQSTFVDSFLSKIPTHGTDFGFDISMLNFMSYFKYKKFAIGVSLYSKTYSMNIIDKNFYNILLKELDIRTPSTFKMNSILMSYVDLNVSLSTRASFIEKELPVEAVFIGMSLHAYIPLLYAQFNIQEGKLHAIDTGNGVMMPGVSMKGTIIAGGPLTGLGSYTGVLNGYNANGGFGLGVDLGFLIQIKKFFKVGFAITDLGFMALPEAQSSKINIDAPITEMPTQMTGIFSGTKTNVSVGLMPATAFRAGIGFTPFKNPELMLIALDVSVGDFHRLLYMEPVTVNVAIGLEFKPSYDWFAAPMRIAFSYNTRSNIPSLSVGIGLHFGPIEFEIGVKGLEFFIPQLGTKEVVFGADIKFNF